MATRKTSTPGTKAPLQVETLKHADDKRKNIPTAEFQSVVQREHQKPVQIRYPRAGSEADQARVPPARWQPNATPATATWTHNSSGAVKTRPTGATSSSTRRRSTSRKRFTPRY
jgi:hypothetical protein